MGNHLAKLQRKVRQQLVNQKENKAYYQNGTEQKTARSETRLNQDRKLP